MYNHLLRALKGSLILALAASFAAAADTAAAGAKIGVLLKVKGEPGSFWASVEQGAVEAGQQLGMGLNVKGPRKESDIAIQVQLLNALVAQGSQVIVIAPSSKEALAGPIAAHAAKGVKFVVIDSPLASASTPIFVGTDHEAAGKAAGAYLASVVGEADEVNLFKNSQTSIATLQREAGALAALRAIKPNLTIHADIFGGSEAGAEKDKAKLVLEKHPAIKAVLASSTVTTLAMLDVLREKKLAGKVKLVGFGFNLSPDVAAAIESGELSAWIAQLPTEIGAKGVQSAAKLLKGESVPAVVQTDFVVITKENLKDPKVQALLKI